jgi:cell division protein FtsB
MSSREANDEWHELREWLAKMGYWDSGSSASESIKKIAEERDQLSARVAVAEANASQLRARVADLLDDVADAGTAVVKLTTERDQLKARVAIEASPVVPGDGFYSYHPEYGFTKHDTAKEAQEDAAASLEFNGDHWHDDIEDVEWGRLIPLGKAIQVNRVDAADDPTGEIAAEGFDYRCGYELQAQPDELARLRAKRDELEAPPVVPEGWEVVEVIRATTNGWALCHSAGDVVALWPVHSAEGNVCLRVTMLAPPAVARAFLWAIEKNQCPPHAAKAPAKE